MQRSAGNGCVLVVEDHPDTLRYLSKLLRMHGYAVHEATTCAQALAVAEREGCQVVVSDVSLPDCSGLTLMRELRERQPGVRGVAVSGHAGAEHARAAREAGFDRHVAKPLKFDDLLDAIRGMMN